MEQAFARARTREPLPLLSGPWQLQSLRCGLCPGARPPVDACMQAVATWPRPLRQEAARRPATALWGGGEGLSRV